MAECQLKLLKQSDWRQPSNLGFCVGYKIVSTNRWKHITPGLTHPSFTFQNQFIEKETGKFKPEQTHTFTKYITPTAHTRKTNRQRHIPWQLLSDTQYFEFHLPRKAPKTPLLNSSFQQQSQESNPQSQDLLSLLASKCKSLFYTQLIERLAEQAVSSHRISCKNPK